VSSFPGPKTPAQSDAFSFRPVTPADLPLLQSWIDRPHVAEWWDSPATLPDEGTSSTQSYIAELNAEAIGFIQAYVVMGSGDGWWESENEPGARGIDQFLADRNRLNRGLGSAMIRSFVTRLFEDPAVTTIQTDPNIANHRAIRCYQRAGFIPVGPVMTPDGPALLMRCDRSSTSQHR